MSRRHWIPEEIDIVRQFYPNLPTEMVAEAVGRSLSAVHNQAAKLGLTKSRFFHQCFANRNKRANSGSFKPGMQPWNAGLKGVTGTHPNSRRTQFKKGEVRGAARHNYVPIGSLRLCKDGYLERKTCDDHPVPARRWVAVHRQVWEAANGPVPDGHIVVFKPGQRTVVVEEITLDRLECISRAENMRRNTIHNYPQEIVRAVQMRGALNRRINHERQDHRRSA
ncbi:HNH endonuclease signature motif containing protein [Orrella sp. JC864]|uniref:HNH endonuclease signature motif containing protein n=1 Tax=Orrella sp. JC864 TaxID=3120298 RepID=UPI00300A2584